MTESGEIPLQQHAVAQSACDGTKASVTLALRQT